MVGKFLANLKKTIYYLKRNGFQAMFFEVMERTFTKKETYVYEEPDKETLEFQRKVSKEMEDTDFYPKISILVPVYQVDLPLYQKMIESALQQTYENWELILADASQVNRNMYEELALQYADARIRYVPLEKNQGISENSNSALKEATGDYIGLLDHDDMLTKDALYEVVQKIMEGSQKGVEYLALYSDEDNCDEQGAVFFEPKNKSDFDLDLLLSYNYICHFFVVKADVLKRLRFCSAYDGAQDYDLALRVSEAVQTYNIQRDDTQIRGEIAHISRVLYHWRWTSTSTSQNPASKEYAYKAGTKAVEAYLQRQGIQAKVKDLPFLGFHRIEYLEPFLMQRPDVGMVVGPVYKRGRLKYGIIGEDGNVVDAGLRKGYSGLLHRQAIVQRIDAGYLYNARIHGNEATDILRKLTGYDSLEQVLAQEKTKEIDMKELSLQYCSELRRQGYKILYDPYISTHSL